MGEWQAPFSKNFSLERVGRSQNTQAEWTGKWPVRLECNCETEGFQEFLLFPPGRAPGQQSSGDSGVEN